MIRRMRVVVRSGANAARTALNAVVVVLGLLVALPAVAAAERLRRGSGRAVAVRAIGLISAACGVRYAVSGADAIDASRSIVYVPNHSSPLDIPAMLVARPEVRFAAASELFRVPLLGTALRALGSVPIDRANTRAARAEIAKVVASPGPLALVVFAEGGIPEPGTAIEFKAGAFAVAIEAGAVVVGVAITGSADVLPRRHKIVVRPGVVRVRLLDPIDTRGLTLRDRKSLRAATQHAVTTALAGA